jgi:hypothetical protein
MILLSTFLFACVERSDDKQVWSTIVLLKQNNVPLVVWPLRWLFCLLGCVGPSILFLVFSLFWVLWFIFHWQGFIIKQGEEREKDVSFVCPFCLHGSREVVTSKSSLLLCFQKYNSKKERKIFILSTLFVCTGGWL